MLICTTETIHNNETGSAIKQPAAAVAGECAAITAVICMEVSACVAYIKFGEIYSKYNNDQLKFDHKAIAYFISSIKYTPKNQVISEVFGLDEHEMDRSTLWHLCACVWRFSYDLPRSKRLSSSVDNFALLQYALLSKVNSSLMLRFRSVRSAYLLHYHSNSGNAMQ